MSDSTMPRIEELLDLEPAAFAEAIRHVPASLLPVINEQVQARRQAKETDIWMVTREIREIESKLSLARFDVQRITDAVAWLGEQIMEGFRRIFREPEVAAHHAWENEQKMGLEKTAILLQHDPDDFGPLKGINLVGIPLAGQQEALEAAKQFPYLTYRQYYDYGRNVKLQLEQMMKGANYDA